MDVTEAAAAFRGTDDEFADFWATDLAAPTGVTCWGCDREIHAYGYRVKGYERRRSWVGGSRLVCPPCYISAAQDNGRRRPNGEIAPGFREWKDGHALSSAPKPCRNCGFNVVLRPDARRGWHTCSEKCRVALYRAEAREVAERRGLELPTCEGCGAELDGRSDQRYCSSACRQRAYRRRRYGTSGSTR